MERSTGHLGTAIHSMRAGSTSKPPGPPPLSFHLAKNLCSSGPLVLVRRGEKRCAPPEWWVRTPGGNPGRVARGQAEMDILK